MFQDGAADDRPPAVVDCEDGQVSAYCVGGLVLDVPAKSLPALVDWTLAEAKLGQTRLHRKGRDADRAFGSGAWGAVAPKLSAGA